jgi:hypothetical protein
MKSPSHLSLFLTHNQHKVYYEPLAEYIQKFGDEEWVSLDEKAKALETNDLWELCWYPETPVGSHLLCASTLDALMAAVEERFLV